jgi:hypothetical protein
MFPQAQRHRSDRSEAAAKRVAFELGAVQARPSQRLPDLPLNLFLRLGGHVELPKTKPYKPDGRLSREQTWRRPTVQARRNRASARVFQPMPWLSRMEIFAKA